MTIKARDKGDKVEAILEAARSLFASHGYEGATVASIGKAAQVASGTVIYHFKTKENLHFILCRQILYDIFRALRQEVRKAATPVEAVAAFVHGYQRYVETHPRDYMVLLQADPFAILDVNQPAFLDLKLFRHWIVLLLEDPLEYGMHQGEIPQLDKGNVSRLIIAMLHAASRAYLAAGTPHEGLFAEVLRFVKARLAFSSTSDKFEISQRPESGQTAT